MLSERQSDGKESKCFSNSLSLCRSLPVPHCLLPMTVLSGKSFKSPNPELRTMVTSYTVLCTALSQAHDEWWWQPVPLPPQLDPETMNHRHDEINNNNNESSSYHFDDTVVGVVAEQGKVVDLLKEPCPPSDREDDEDDDDDDYFETAPCEF